MKKKDNEIKCKSLLPEDQNPITKPIFSGGFETPCPLTEDQRTRFLKYQGTSRPNGWRWGETAGLFQGEVRILEKDVLHSVPTMRLVILSEQHVRFDGTMSEPQTWFALQRKSGVAVVIYHEIKKCVLIVEQLRPAIFVPHRKNFETIEEVNGRVLELVAGGLDEGEDPIDCVRREVSEETGLALNKIKFVYDFYLSPGGTNENILLFYAPINFVRKNGKGGGLKEEGEDIRVHWIPIKEAKRMLDEGLFRDAKTIIGLQWFFNNVIKK